MIVGWFVTIILFFLFHPLDLISSRMKGNVGELRMSWGHAKTQKTNRLLSKMNWYSCDFGSPPLTQYSEETKNEKEQN